VVGGGVVATYRVRPKHGRLSEQASVLLHRSCTPPDCTSVKTQSSFARNSQYSQHTGRFGTPVSSLPTPPWESYPVTSGSIPRKSRFVVHMLLSMFFEVSSFGNPGTMPVLPLLMVHPPEQQPSMVRRDHKFAPGLPPSILHMFE
jgi:hypothetical protein